MYVYIEQISLMRHKLDRIDRLGHAACWRCYNAACCARHSPAWICQLCLQCADTRVAFRLPMLHQSRCYLQQLSGWSSLSGRFRTPSRRPQQSLALANKETNIRLMPASQCFSSRSTSLNTPSRTELLCLECQSQWPIAPQQQ